MIKFIIDVRTTGLHIKVMFQQDKKILQDFYGELSSFEERYVPGRGKIRTLKKTYATYMAETATFGLHRNLLDSLMEHLSDKLIKEEEIKINYYTPLQGTPTRILLNPDWSPREKQVPIIDFIMGPEPVSILPIQTGAGKDQPLDAKIKIPGGWSTMGEMKIGTDVISKDGSITKVTAIYPQGLKQMYQITFADGRTTEAGAGHLWKVYYINTTLNKRWRVVDTLEMLRLISMPNPRVYVDLIDPEIGNDIDLPIDPYVLGVILGDGCTRGNAVTISNPDIEIKDKITLLLKDTYNVNTYVSKDSSRCLSFSLCPKDRNKSFIKDNLKELGLFGKYSYEKFIPDIYLNSSSKQRLELLQGLMDTDGTISNRFRKSGTSSYSTTSLLLAEHVTYLVRSLGGIASISSKHPMYTYKGETLNGRLAYVINIRFKRPTQLFTLTRKLNLAGDEYQYGKTLKLRVLDIKPSRVVESQCITVDHPDHLYVTDDFIVTHNTYIALYTIAKKAVRTAVIMGAMHIETWVKDAAKFYSDTSGIKVIRGAAMLKKAIADAKLGKYNADITFFSVNTVRDYLTEYAELGYSTYGCEPIELYATLGISFRVTDEVHENLHFNFRHDIETEVAELLYLSATIESDDAFINKLYQTIYPPNRRYTGLAWVKYIDVVALGYNLDDPRTVRYKGGNGMYSHNEYEKWIMKDYRRLKNYLDMICKILEVGYIKNYEPTMKCLIFFSSIEMCSKAAEYYANIYPERSVSAYNGDHDDEVLHSFDIVCSTLGSSGTGKNIYGLVTTILTVALSNREKNLQVLGRLREIDKVWPHRTPKFYYLVCKDIPKHVQYHNNKLKIFTGVVKTHTSANLSYRI